MSRIAAGMYICIKVNIYIYIYVGINIFMCVNTVYKYNVHTKPLIWLGTSLFPPKLQELLLQSLWIQDPGWHGRDPRLTSGLSTIIASKLITDIYLNIIFFWKRLRIPCLLSRDYRQVQVHKINNWTRHVKVQVPVLEIALDKTFQ